MSQPWDKQSTFPLDLGRNVTLQGWSVAVVKCHRVESQDWNTTALRSSKTFQGESVADSLLGGHSVRIEMSRGCFVGGRHVKTPHWLIIP
jgi:hypothetical protein